MHGLWTYAAPSEPGFEGRGAGAPAARGRLTPAGLLPDRAVLVGHGPVWTPAGSRHQLDLRLPDQSTAPPPLPGEPKSMIGVTAAPIQVASWFNSSPLGPTPAKGKVRILDFWGTQCAPCIAALPKIEAFWKAHQSDPLELIALTWDTPDGEIHDVPRQPSISG